MRISKIEVGNFRKLVAVRMDLSDDKTVLVGANNSGKTSAMVVLHRFLVDPRDFTINDFSLAHWPALNAQGAKWEAAYQAGETLPDPDLGAFVPQIDIWLEVGKGEMHYVQKILPSLDWTYGPLGVRLRFEPNDATTLQQEYLAIRTKSSETLKAAARAGGTTAAPAVELWPQNLVQFLDRRLKALFKIKAYILDPAQLNTPVNGQARMQPLAEGTEPL